MTGWLEDLASDPTHAGWETLAAVATVLAAVIAVGALIGVAIQVKTAQSTDREAVAHSIWGEYLRLAFDNPDFAAPNFRQLCVSSQLEKYEWFVSIMLFGAEQILMSRARQRPWKKIIVDQIRFHFDYIQTDQFRKLYLLHYSQPVQEAIAMAEELGPFTNEEIKFGASADG